MKYEQHKIIGQLIKEEVERQGLSAKKFGEMICCERANVYKILLVSAKPHIKSLNSFTIKS